MLCHILNNYMSSFCAGEEENKERPGKFKQYCCSKSKFHSIRLVSLQLDDTNFQ